MLEFHKCIATRLSLRFFLKFLNAIQRGVCRKGACVRHLSGIVPCRRPPAHYINELLSGMLWGCSA